MTPCSHKPWCRKPNRHRGACWPFHEQKASPLTADPELVALFESRTRIYRDARWPGLHAYVCQGGNNRGQYVVYFGLTCIGFVFPDGRTSAFPINRYDSPEKRAAIQSLRASSFQEIAPQTP